MALIRNTGAQPLRENNGFSKVTLYVGEKSHGFETKFDAQACNVSYLVWGKLGSKYILYLYLLFYFFVTFWDIHYGQYILSIDSQTCQRAQY